MVKQYDVKMHPRLVEQREKRRKTIYRWIIISTLFLATLIFGLSYFSAHPKITISKITVSGNRIIGADKIESIVYESINGRYVYLFKKSNIFIYPKRQIIKNIQNEFPRIKNIEINNDELTGIFIKIDERVGAYLYCGESMPQSGVNLGDDCYFINDDGYIFDKAPFFSGNVYIKFYAPLNDKDMEILGNSTLSPEKIKDFLAIVEKLKEMNFQTAMIDLGNPNEQNIFLKRGSTILPRIIFKQENDLEEILNNLSSSMKQQKFVDEVQGNFSTLDYIDLRFKNKVLYKNNG